MENPLKSHITAMIPHWLWDLNWFSMEITIIATNPMKNPKTPMVLHPLERFAARHDGRPGEKSDNLPGCQVQQEKCWDHGKHMETSVEARGMGWGYWDVWEYHGDFMG